MGVPHHFLPCWVYAIMMLCGVSDVLLSVASGEHPDSTFSGPLGTEFITTFIQNGLGHPGNPMLFITAYTHPTAVTVSVNQVVYKVVTIPAGQTIMVTLSPQTELKGIRKFDNTVTIRAEKKVSVLSFNSKEHSADTSIVYPARSLGKEYYVMTPLLGPRTTTEFAIVAWQEPTTVDISLEGHVTYEREKYLPGRKLTLQLNAYQAVQLQSYEDLSKTRITSGKPVAVYSGAYVCGGKRIQCEHVSEQLLPVSSWELSFIVPPLPFKTEGDSVYLLASQGTEVHLLNGEAESSRFIEGKEMVKYPVSQPLVISANSGVQVLFFSSGGKKGSMIFEPFFMTIPGLSSYCQSYNIYGHNQFENYALIIARTSATTGITFDKKPLDSVTWNAITDTEYSWAEYSLGKGFSTHSMEHPTAPFGLLSIGIGDHKGYGSPATCTGDIQPPSCDSKVCEKGTACVMRDGEPQCTPLTNGVCWVMGNMHYKTFDGQNYNFQGTCIYTLAKTCGDDSSLPSFHIETKNEKSMTSQVAIHVHGVIVTVGRFEDGFVKVNGESYNLPVIMAGGQLRVYQHGRNIMIQTSFGLTVSYDLVYHVRVTVPWKYQGQVCGLCGNYNKDGKDEFSLPGGSLAPDTAAFGSAWKVPGVSCTDGCGGNSCPVCEGGKVEKLQQENYCGILSAEYGPFADCHNSVDPSPYFSSCVYDLCLGREDSQILCWSIQSYVMACQDAGVNIQLWRSDSFCPLSCPANSHYHACPDLWTHTCYELKTSLDSPKTCAEGCQCDNGFVFNGQDCVVKESCGCFKDGRYYQPNENVLVNKCQQSCTCRSDHEVICKAHHCASDENCEVRDGIMSCINKDPCKVQKCRAQEKCNVENGRAKCVPKYSASCTGCTGLHYHTFDGLQVTYQDTCTYTIASYCGDDPTLLPFTINEKNNCIRNASASEQWATNIKVYGYKITIYRKELDLIRLNSVTAALPLTLKDGKIQIVQINHRPVLRTDFGLRVTYDAAWIITVTVPSSYYGATCGLCGNFNGVSKDDTTFPLGPISEVDFSNSWKAEDTDIACWDYCQGRCRECELGERQLYGDDYRCGIITKAPEGPFRDCHARVNPDDFFHSCIHAMCLNWGNQSHLCQELEAYAIACRKHGVTVDDWRTPSGCDLPCPANSHYEVCGSACPATCSDRTGPSSCKKPCVETCQCNDGYILHAGECIPVESCGCYYHDHYYKPNETFWSDDKCHTQCRCERSQDMHMVVCKKSRCKGGQKCVVVDGVRGCHALKYSICIGTGDPHYTTFDGKKFDFMGSCIYQLAGTCSPNPKLVPFTVKVENNNRGNNLVSFTKVVTLEVYNLTISLSQEYPQKIQVDGVFVDLPFYHKDKLKAYISGVHGFIHTDFDLKVSFDWYSYARVIVPSMYANATCGLCGNNNEDTADDMTMKNGTLTSDEIQFADSWKVGEVPGCHAGCLNDCPKCSEEMKKTYRGDKYCGVIIKKNGPFHFCHKVIDPASYFDDCVFDTCQYKAHHDTLCSTISTYVTACQAQGIRIGKWRSAAFCSLNCPPNSHYDYCGTGCPSTCHSRLDPDECEAPCVEGCFCDEGFVLSGEKCVPYTDCGCMYEGRYYKKGEEFYTSTSCHKQCQCNEDGELECKDVSCDANEECKVVNGVQGCHPLGYGKCVSCNPHYMTFDGKAFDLHGNCTYTLAKVNSMDPRLMNFSVVVENESMGSGRVARKRTVTVFIYGRTIVLEREMRWKAVVDGELYTLPVTMNNGKLQVNQEGNNIILQTSAGLQVLYDTFSCAFVTLPGTYKGYMRGLCGNFNSNKNDDFLLPNGKSTKSLSEFESSWRVLDDGATCSEGCDGRCPVCDAAKKKPYQAETSCGLIGAPSGPFHACHSHVNPAEYVNYCLYDMCASNGARETLCQSLQAYVTACQEAGAEIGAWRKPSLCPLTCPANSHYELCTKNCDLTCASLTTPPQCTKKCFEGCQCNDGYMSDGEACVSMEKCGCLRDGRYLQPGETFLSSDCSQRCTCLELGKLDCKEAKCLAMEKCLVRDGERRCVKEEGQCMLASGAQLTTFDRASVKVPSNRIYSLASLCNSSAPSWFRVVVEVKESSKTHVATVTAIYISIDNTMVSVNKEKETQLNEEPTVLPVTLKGGKIHLSQSNGRFALQTDFGFKVIYDKDWTIMVTVPFSTHGTSCGLCGNFNGISEDDPTFPLGLFSEEDISDRWAVHDGSPPFWDSCHEQCLPCDLGKKRLYGDKKRCGLIKKGPFQECHATVNPNNFFHTCIQSMCLDGGTHRGLCHELEAYANACLKQGVPLRSWRMLSGCVLSCPENSHYEICGNACPATCFDQTAPSFCEKPCIEICQCNTGYVLSAGQCISEEACSCMHNDRSYKLDEEFWGDEMCRSWCKCERKGERLEVVCRKSSCKDGKKCVVMDGVRGCHEVNYATCIATGDVHYTTFDGKKYDFVGTCVYQLAGVCTPDPRLVPFTVQVENSNRGSTAVSFTKVVTLDVYNMTISLSQEHPQKIQVDGIFVNLPFQYKDKLKAYISGVHGFIQTDFSLRVSFDWYSHTRVLVPNTYADAMCGLCGNNNEDATDDMMMKNGIQTSDELQFANSWKVREVPGCRKECLGDCPVCGELQMQVYKGDKYCGIITRKNGPFSLCHRVIDPAPYFDNCIFDTCHYSGHHNMMCHAISSYVTSCQAQSIWIGQWRSASFCSFNCPSNTHYEFCGTGCPNSCHNVLDPDECELPCREGCFCNDGFILSGDKCIPSTDCGCMHQGRYYKKGEEFYTSTSCEERCQCGNSGVIKCQDISCSSNEECKVINGVQGCYASESGKCIAWSDSYYVTFDGNTFNLHSNCAYTLAEVNSIDAKLQIFLVVIENERAGKDWVSVTKTIKVSVDGHTIVMKRGTRWKVAVDGELYSLPVAINKGKLQINQEGKNIVLQSAAGFQVLYDTSSYVLVTVPSTYKGQTRGLCGNYNGDKNDDLLLPSEKIAKSMSEFESSWRVLDDGATCSEGCDGRCPVCDAAKKKPYQAVTSCGLITARSGPFQDCHSLVSPDDYFHHCLHVMCAANGARETLCQSLQAYAATCQAEGATIREWRKDSFCPLSCPTNSHYELCTKTCDLTCASLTTPTKCIRRCFEGCQCNTGYMFDGEACVSMGKCGCMRDGHYIEPGQTFFSNDCSEKCTCHEMGKLECREAKCLIGEKCQVKDGARICVKQEARCTLASGTLLTSFDGVSGNVLPNKFYNLASLCNDSSPSWFRVVVNVRKCNEKVAAADVTLYVFFDNAMISINNKKEAWVNGRLVKLPLVSKSFSISLSQDAVVITNKSSLDVLFHPGKEVTVKVSSILANQLCAPCGNYNGNSADDLRLPSGAVAKSLSGVLEAWEATDL
ncbi:IgGFc-binding protein [Alligator mississippiensis]|uniref:IgGFc-binding protein n=1 Tax=Alligator mississippiensis TaxID=8496 RepID=UPI00287750B5|nr:IgGFc-binding protein [Alligator mississippiensis]